MPIYAYKATDPFGKILKGSLEAGDEKGAADRLQEMGFIPIRISQTNGDARKTDISERFLGLFQRVSSRDIMQFTRDMATLLASGIPVDRALSIQMTVADNHRLKEMIQEILKSVRSGSYLSDAIGKYPKVFPNFYVNMVRAGEMSGVLDSVLDRLGTFMENIQDLKDYTKSALIYPIFLVCVGGISIIILMTFVIPKFSIIFSDLGPNAIPFPTRILLFISGVFRSYWWIGVLAFIFTGWIFKRYANSAKGRWNLDSIKLKLPIVKEWVQKLEVGRFTRTLGTLVKSGVPMLQALDLVRTIINNTVIASALETVRNRVKEGEKLSRPLEDSRLFPSLAIQMITVGEETGKLDEMLLKIADTYEKNVRNLVKRFISLLEPAMILIMGIVVAFIVISMLMAIFSINDLPF